MDITLAIAVSIAVDRQHTCIAAAGKVGEVAVFDIVDYLPGTDTAAAIAATIKQRDVKEVALDPRSPAATLIEPLRELKVAVY